MFESSCVWDPVCPGVRTAAHDGYVLVTMACFWLRLDVLATFHIPVHQSSEVHFYFS